MIALRPYQEEAIAAVEQSDKRRQLVALPTGTGKTVVFSDLIRRRGGTALILAHRDELLQQAHKKLTTVAPELGMSVGFVQAQRNDTHSPVVIASVQTLARQARLHQLPDRFDTVIVDEAHHATAESYQRIVDHVLDSPLIVGFTATPKRADRSQLGDVFEELVYTRSIEDMIREGYLSDLRGLRIVLEDLDLASVKKSRGDYQAEDLGRALDEADVIDHVAAAYLEHAPGRKALAFFPTVALAHKAAERFLEAGVPAAAVDGQTPRDDRRELLAKFTRGEHQVVCNVGVLTEGFDEPSVDCVIVAAPTRSSVKYTQMVGRGTRTFPGKDDCLVLDLVGVTEDLKLQSLAQLFKLKKSPKPNETVLEAQERELEELARHDERAARKRDYDKARRKARSVELFSRDRIHWTRLAERWVVGLKDDIVVLDPPADGREGGWRVLVVQKDRAKVAAHDLDFGYATGVAEQLVRDAGAEVLADKEAPWRQLPASDGQRGMLRRLRVSVDDAGALTKGEAADLITTRIAEQRLERLDRALAVRAIAAQQKAAA